MHSTRRDFIRYAGAVSLGFLGLHKLNLSYGHAIEDSSIHKYGPLLPDPKGVMNLPKGFSYQLISQKGETMSDGLLVPGMGDGMATFAAGRSRTIIVRNHENNVNDFSNSAFGKDKELLSKISREKFYDFGRGESPCTGGTTTLVYNHQTRKVESQYLSLAGTLRNCAGGPTPWGSWLTCEETVVRADNILEKDHGYVFEVPASLKSKLADPHPLKGMGRYNHEAVAIDPATGIVYLTEDSSDGLLYRYVPNTPKKLSAGGKLQALCLMDQASADTRNWEAASIIPGQAYNVRWIDMTAIDSPDNDLRIRGYKDGAARFARGEGMWYGNGEIYFACTNGGMIKGGQVFKYKPGQYEGSSRENESPGVLQLFVEPNDKEIFKYCDNLTIAPWGDVVLCEDDKHPFIVGVTQQGQYYKIAENVGYPSEFAGAVFSSDGKTLFVNIQGPGLTLSIEGPWV